MTAMIDTEPCLARLLEERKSRRSKPPYKPRIESEVEQQLRHFFATAVPGAEVSGVSRMGGGASKEQFVFFLAKPGKDRTRYVLRMDPLEAVTETDRAREFQALRMFQGIVPAPIPVWMDEDGSSFGTPAMIMEFVGGTTKPSEDQGIKVSGLGTLLGPRLRELLKDEFLQNLAAIHGADWRNADLPSFSVPNDDPKQPARWQLEYWAELWRQDGVDDPVMTMAENWLRRNLPDCSELVFVHGDYRTGNYLFDEATGKITAMLDWELAYIGDYHDDLGWILMRIFGTHINGEFRASDLYGRDEFIAAYENATGRVVNRQTLHFYDVLSAYKCYIIVVGTGLAVSRSAHNHQDVLLTYLAGAGPLFKADMCRLLEESN